MIADTSLEENKRIVRAFIDAAFNQHKPDRASEYMTADITWHGGTLGTVEGRDSFAGLIGAIVAALPDLSNVEQDIIAERDIVCVRRAGRGNAQRGPSRNPGVGQAGSLGCGRCVPRCRRKDRRGVGGGRPARVRLHDRGLHAAVARQVGSRSTTEPLQPPYSSWRRNQMPPGSLRPSGARSSHWYIPQSPSSPRAYAE